MFAKTLGPLLLCVAPLLIGTVSAGCFTYEIDNDPVFSCLDDTAGYEPEVAGCQISRSCGWHRPLSFESTEYNFVGSVVCYGEDGGTQQCSCATATTTETVLHSFEFSGACSATGDEQDELAVRCGWHTDPEPGAPVTVAVDTHDGDTQWMVTIESAVIASTNLNKELQSWDPQTGNALPDVFVEGTSDDELTFDWSSSTVKDSTSPAWNEPVATYWAFDLVRDGLLLSVYDDDPVVDDLIGSCDLAVSRADLADGTITRQCGDNVNELTIRFVRE